MQITSPEPPESRESGHELYTTAPILRAESPAVFKSTHLPEVSELPLATPSSQNINADTDLSTLSNAQLFELNQSFLEDITPNRPLIGTLEPMETLRADHEGNFVNQIDWLISEGYIGIRRARGDGNCFYRALAFAYIASILESSEKDMAVAAALSRLESHQLKLKGAEFQKIVYEDVYDIFVSLINQIVTPEVGGTVLTISTLVEAFQSPEVSNSIVMYLRLLTSAQIRSDPDNFAPFLFHPEDKEPMEPSKFCQDLVEPLGKEADDVQITALSQAMELKIKVAYVDGQSPDRVNFVEFNHSDSESPVLEPLTLLYRPGHYDILSKKDSDI